MLKRRQNDRQKNWPEIRITYNKKRRIPEKGIAYELESKTR